MRSADYIWPIAVQEIAHEEHRSPRLDINDFRSCSLTGFLFLVTFIQADVMLRWTGAFSAIVVARHSWRGVAGKSSRTEKEKHQFKLQNFSRRSTAQSSL